MEVGGLGTLPSFPITTQKDFIVNDKIKKKTENHEYVGRYLTHKQEKRGAPLSGKMGLKERIVLLQDLWVVHPFCCAVKLLTMLTKTLIRRVTGENAIDPLYSPGTVKGLIQMQLKSKVLKPHSHCYEGDP